MTAFASVPFAEALGVWARIGVLSFGGPTAQIALMHRVLVDEKRWLDEETYLRGLAVCMLLPGPEAMQLAAYAGWRLHGLRGAIGAAGLFVLPGAIVVLALAATYAALGQVPLVQALFLGVKAAVVVIVVEALLRIARRALKGAEHWIIAAIAFVGIYALHVPFPLIVLGAAIYGFFRPAPSARAGSKTPETTTVGDQGLHWRRVALGVALWLVPLGLVAAGLGGQHVLSQLALFFTKLALVTFGGAYAVLAYMAQDVVQHYGWLDAGAMMDGLGLAETTPGPLILVTEFVGYLAAYRNAGGPPVVMGLAGAGIALWATFVPAFLWVFAASPYIAWITRQPRLAGALGAVTAAVVGVILNLAVWFALHVLFGEVGRFVAGPVDMAVPVAGSLDLRAVALSGLAAVLLLWRHWSIGAVLAVSAGLALLAYSVGI